MPRYIIGHSGLDPFQIKNPEQFPLTFKNMDFRRLVYEKALNYIKTNNFDALKNLLDPSVRHTKAKFNFEEAKKYASKELWNHCNPEELCNFDAFGFKPTFHPKTDFSDSEAYERIDQSLDWDKIQDLPPEALPLILQFKLVFRECYHIQHFFKDGIPDLRWSNLWEGKHSMFNINPRDPKCFLYRREDYHFHLAVLGKEFWISNYTDPPNDEIEWLEFFGYYKEFQETHFDLILDTKKFTGIFLNPPRENHKNADIANYFTKNNRSILHEAIDCYEKNPEILRYLLSLKFNPFTCGDDGFGEPALFYAIQNKKVSVIDEIFNAYGSIESLLNTFHENLIIANQRLDELEKSPVTVNVSERKKVLQNKKREVHQFFLEYGMRLANHALRTNSFTEAYKHLAYLNALFPEKLYILYPLIQSIMGVTSQPMDWKERNALLDQALLLLSEFIKTQSTFQKNKMLEPLENPTFNDPRLKTISVQSLSERLFREKRENINHAFSKELRCVLSGQSIDFSTFNELLEKGANINLTDAHLNTPLHLLLKTNDERFLPLIEYLILHGAHLTSINQEKETPLSCQNKDRWMKIFSHCLEYAIENNKKEILDYLCRKEILNTQHFSSIRMNELIHSLSIQLGGINQGTKNRTLIEKMKWLPEMKQLLIQTKQRLETEEKKTQSILAARLFGLFSQNFAFLPKDSAATQLLKEALKFSPRIF